MFPLADTHVHLLAGRDDGPRTEDEALAMCRMLVAEGVRTATALAHQNTTFPGNTTDTLRTAAIALAERLKAERIPLSVVPAAEVILGSETVADWQAGKLLSIADRGKCLLAEMPHGMFLDPRLIAGELRPLGVRLVLAHTERYDQLLFDPGLTAQCIAAGCLIQVTTESLADPPTARHDTALREWATRGMIHVLCSDGHRIDRRQPRWQPGFRRLAKWIGLPAAERIGGIWGTALLQGLAVNPPPPKPPQKSWFARMFG